MKKINICLFIVLILSSSCFRDSSVESTISLGENLQKALDDGIKEFHGKGISAAIVMPNEEIWLGTSGLSHEAIKITSDMYFAVGSITKMFTAATILQLAEEELLSLEDSLYSWLPNYSNIDSTITIRQLLNHTSGVFDIHNNPDYWNAIWSYPQKYWTPEEVITEFTLTPYFAKGEGWSYSNTGYLLLDLIIEKASESDLSTEFSNRFWSKLDLNNIFLGGEDESFPENVAHGWRDSNNGHNSDDVSIIPRTARYSAVWSAGAILSTAENIARWSHALFYKQNVINQNSLNHMLSFYSPCPGENNLDGYGLGVEKYSNELFNGLEVWGHGGHVPGYSAGSFYLADYDTSIIILDNTDNGAAMPTVFKLIDIIINHQETTQ